MKKNKNEIEKNVIKEDPIYKLIIDRNFEEAHKHFNSLDSLLVGAKKYPANKIDILEFMGTLENPDWHQIFSSGFIMQPKKKDIETLIDFFNQEGIEIGKIDKDGHPNMFTLLIYAIRSNYDSSNDLYKKLFKAFPQDLAQEFNNNVELINLVFPYYINNEKSVVELMTTFINSFNKKSVKETEGYKNLMTKNSFFMDCLNNFNEENFYKILGNSFFSKEYSNILESNYLISNFFKEVNSFFDFNINLKDILISKIESDTLTIDKNLLHPNLKDKLDKFSFKIDAKSDSLPIIKKLLATNNFINDINHNDFYGKYSFLENYLKHNLYYVPNNDEKVIDSLNNIISGVLSFEKLGIQLSSCNIDQKTLNKWFNAYLYLHKKESDYPQEIIEASKKMDLSPDIILQVRDFFDNRYPNNSIEKSSQEEQLKKSWNELLDKIDFEPKNNSVIKMKK